MSVTIASVLPPVDGMVTPRPEGMVTPQQQSGAAAEQQMFDYLVRSHLEALAAPAVHMANPAALAGQTLARLRGFIESAHRFDATLKHKMFRTTTAVAIDEPFDLHPGPAWASLGLEDDESIGALNPEKAALIANRITDEFHETIIHQLWVSLVSRCALAVPHDVNTLLKGQ